MGDMGWVGATWGKKLNNSAGFIVQGRLDVPIIINPDAGVQEIDFPCFKIIVVSSLAFELYCGVKRIEEVNKLK